MGLLTRRVWRAATAASANDGRLTFWIDRTQQANITGIENDTRRVDRAFDFIPF